jgi:hypothetical protein
MGPVNVSWEAIALTLSRALRGSVLRKGCGAIANRRLGIVVDESEADGHPRGAPLIIRLGRGAFPNETYFVHKKNACRTERSADRIPAACTRLVSLAV